MKPVVYNVREKLKRKPGEFDEMENIFFFNYYKLAVSRFNWLNLPDEIEPYFIEDVMFYNAKGLFIYDDIANMYAFMRCNLTGEIDIYNIPEDRYAFANTGYLKEYNKKNSVLLWDSPIAFPLCNIASAYARSMANCWNTRDINMFVQRTPFVIASSEEQKLSAENLIQKFMRFFPVIKVNNKYDMENLKALNLNAPYNVDKIEDEMLVLESKFMTYLGIESNPTSKRERAITGEVEGNNGSTEMYRNAHLGTRKRFCEQVNKMFGLNIDVEFNSNLPTKLNLGPDILNAGGDIE